MTEDFLMNSANKNDLNEFLAKKFKTLYRGDQIFNVTYQDTVLTNHPGHCSDQSVSIVKCQSEEADQRIIRHSLHCVDQDFYNQIVVRTIDTDVLILLISNLGGFRYDAISDVDIYANMINSSIYYDIGKIVAFLGTEVCKALPFFYSFTGCDIVPSFYGKGKCKAWDIWMSSEHKDHYCDLFAKLCNKPDCVTVTKLLLR